MDALRKAKMGSGSDEESGPKSGPVVAVLSEAEGDEEEDSGGAFEEAADRCMAAAKKGDAEGFRDALKAAIYACMEE